MLAATILYYKLQNEVELLLKMRCIISFIFKIAAY